MRTLRTRRHRFAAPWPGHREPRRERQPPRRRRATNASSRTSSSLRDSTPRARPGSLALCPFRWRRLHGRPGDREGPGLRLGLALLLALGLGLRLDCRDLLREDRFLLFAGEQTLEL